MGLPQVDIRSPHDHEAEKWLDRYESYMALADERPRALARIHAWTYEPHAWVMAAVTITVLWLPGGWFIAGGMLAVVYWLWASTHTPRVVQWRNKLHEDGRVLCVPEVLLELYAQSMHKIDADHPFTVADKQQRFVVLGIILRENADLVELVANDCGCKVPCTHMGRLEAGRSEEGAATRTGLHRRLRRNITRKLAQAAAEKP